MVENKFRKQLNLLILIAALVLLSGCPPRDDNIYPVSEEEYLLGWTLHNINEATPRQISYSLKDLAVYNYSYNYPSTASIRYDNVLWWIAPFQDFAAATRTRLSVPENRLYYLKGEQAREKSRWNRNWSFSNSIHINYLTSEDPSIQFGFDNAHKEGYNSETIFNDIVPMPGLKEHIYFGTSPFTPASVIVADNFLRLNDKLLRGFNGKSYLVRGTSITVWWNGEIKEIKLPTPKYGLYRDNNLIEEKDLTDFWGTWDHRALNYYLENDGKYDIEIEIPSGYPVFAETKSKTSFVKQSGKKIMLPVIKHIEFPARFKINEPMLISVQFENENIVKNFSMFYKTNAMRDWERLAADKFRAANLAIKDEEAKQIDFRFDAATDNSSASYEIYSISLRSLNVTCSHDLNYFKMGNIARTFVYGNCFDEAKNLVSGIRVELHYLKQYLGSVMTDAFGSYNFEIEGIGSQIVPRAGEVIPVFKGTGVYAPYLPLKGNAPSMSSIIPFKGPINTRVNIIGSGFTSTNNDILFGKGYIYNLSSNDGKRLQFKVPKNVEIKSCFENGECKVEILPIYPGDYAVSVSNANGNSNSLIFTVI